MNLLGLTLAAALPLLAHPSIVHFEPNRGQADGRAKFVARAGGMAALLAADRLALPDVRFDFIGANPQAVGAGEKALIGRANYFHGRDPKGWLTDIPQYAQVRFRAVYPGVDVVYYGRDGKVEYDFVVAPGADPGRIRMRFDSGQTLRLTAAGDLEIGSAAKLHRPEASQHGRRVTANFRLKGRDVTLTLGDYDRTRPLTIDPVLSYSIALGGTGIAVDSQGNSYVVGTAVGANWPMSTGLDISGPRNGSAFVIKLDPTGKTVLYAAYLGGSGRDDGLRIAVDGAGYASITGVARSTDFPLVSPYQSTGDAQGCPFVARLGPAGNSLVFSTYLGGSGARIDALAVHAATGSTYVARYPYYTTTSVMKFSPAGAVLYSRDITSVLIATGLTVSQDGEAYVSGTTLFGQFATTPGVIGAGPPTSYQAFLVKLNADSSIAFATLLATGYGGGVVLDNDKNIYYAGSTSTAGLPVSVGAYQPSLRGGSDWFVAKLCPDATCIRYATYLGGAGQESMPLIALTPSGQAVIAGSTTSKDLPLAGAIQSTHGGYGHALLAVSDFGAAFSPVATPDGTSPLYVDINPADAQDILLIAGFQPYRSRDGGRQWSASTSVSVQKLHRSAANANIVIGYGTANYRSTDGGSTWTQSMSAIDNLASVTSDPSNSQKFWGLGKQGFIYGSTDGGVTWSQVLYPPPTPARFLIALDSNTLLAGGSGGIYATGNPVDWKLTPLPAPDTVVWSMAVHPADRRIFYVAGDQRLLKTTDAGATFSVLPLDYPVTVYLSPADPQVVYCVDTSQRLWASRDGGTSFNEAGPLPVPLSQIAPAPSAGGFWGIAAHPDSLYVARLNPAGSAVEFATYLGGPAAAVWGLAVDADNIYLTGSTGLNFPITPGTYPSGLTGFTAKISSLTPACQVSVTPTSIGAFSGQVGRITVIAPSGCAWTATSNADWITITSSGSGTGWVDYRLAPNTTAGRTGTITIAGQTVTITEAGPSCAYSFAPVQIPTQPAAGATVHLDLTAPSGCAWSFSSLPSWIVPSPNQGTGAAGIDLTIAPAVDKNYRTWYGQLAGRAIAISQNGLCTTPDVGPLSLRVPAYSSDFAVQVATNAVCSWSGVRVRYDSSWISPLSPTSGTGPATLRFRVDANSGASVRAGMAYVTNWSGDINFINVTQAAGANPAHVPRALVRNAAGDFELYEFGSSTPVAVTSGAFAVTYASAQDSQGRVAVAALDTNGGLSANNYDPVSRVWSGWAYAGGLFKGSPAIVVDGYVRIALRDTFDGYWVAQFDSAAKTFSWQKLGGLFSTDPAMAWDSPSQRLYIVGKDKWNALWSAQLSGSTFSPWRYLAGIVRGKPAVTVGTDGVAYIAARDSWDSLWITRVDQETPLGWAYAGGIMSKDPQIAVLGEGTVVAVIADAWGVPWTATLQEGPPTGWPSWKLLGGLLDNFGATANASILYLAGRDPWNNLWWYRSTDNSWVSVDTGGRLRGAVAVSP